MILNKKIIVALVILLVVIVSCSKMDSYKEKFEKGGPITYAGKMDSVNVLPGRNRVVIKGLFTSDPNIVKYRVFWKSRQDSIEVPVKRSSGVDTPKIIIPNLEEGTQSFEIRTYDKLGNSSVPVYVTGNVYGDAYQSSIINRGVVDASLQNDGSALITWADVSPDAGVLSMYIQYKDAANNLHDTIINSIAIGQATSLPNIKVGSSFSYRTAFLPAPNAVDTFYTLSQTHSVKADVTSIYLSNVGPDFKGALSSDGRFGILAAPWVTNDGAKNKGNAGTKYGGYQHASWQSAGVITWETWNNTPVVDGKLYQVTSSPLPAGTYTISFNYYSEIQSNSSVYVIAASGGNGIPSSDSLSNALGYSALFNGATVGTTSPNVTETKSFNFTISTPQFVSIGVLGNIIGNGNPGSYFEIRSISLIQN